MYYGDMSASLLSLNIGLSSLGLLILMAFIADEIKSFRDAVHVHQRVLSTLSLTALTLFWLQPASMLLSVIFFRTNAHVCCDIIITATYSVYWLGKGVYASVFLVRLYAMGKAAVILAYPFKLIITLCIVLFVGTIAISFLWTYEHIINGYIDSNNNTKKCILADPMYLMVITGIFEAGFGILLLCLFIKKLVSTYQSGKMPNPQTQHLINKNTVLVIITHSFSFGIGILTLYVFYPARIHSVSFDLVINALCLAMMKKSWNEWYQVSCKYPDRCINGMIHGITDLIKLTRLSPSETIAHSKESNMESKSKQDEIQLEYSQSITPESPTYRLGAKSLTPITNDSKSTRSTLDSIPEDIKSIGPQLEPINKQISKMEVKDSFPPQCFQDAFGCSFEDAFQKTLTQARLEANASNAN